MSKLTNPLSYYLHDPTWNRLLKEEFSKDYMKSLEEKLKDDYEHKVIYPNPDDLFSAFNLTPFEKSKSSSLAKTHIMDLSRPMVFVSRYKLE